LRYGYTKKLSLSRQQAGMIVDFVVNIFQDESLWLIRINNDLNAEGKPKYLNPLSWFYENLYKPIFPATPGSVLLFMRFFYCYDVVFGVGAG
jgi:hypothetical protein